MRPGAHYVVIEDDLGKPLVIRDVGHSTGHPTVTNDVENVVAELLAGGFLPPERRLFYIDSDGHKDEILLSGGRFDGFQFGARE